MNDLAQPPWRQPLIALFARILALAAIAAASMTGHATGADDAPPHSLSSKLFRFPLSAGFASGSAVPALSRTRARPELNVFYQRDWQNVSPESIALGDERFDVGYFQIAYPAAPWWTAYGRIENAWHRQSEPALELQPQFVSLRGILGSRLAVTRNQALQLELSHNERPVDRNFTLLQLQWRLVYP